MFLLCESIISIIPISRDYDGFKFFWSCPTFWKNVFSFDHVFHDYSRLYFLCFCFGYFLVKVQSFQCFYFYLVSASASWMIASIWCPVFFPFSKPSIIPFSISVFISANFIPILWAWIIEEKVFLPVEYLYWYFFFFCAVSHYTLKLEIKEHDDVLIITAF